MRLLVFERARTAGLPVILVTHDEADAEAAGRSVHVSAPGERHMIETGDAVPILFWEGATHMWKSFADWEKLGLGTQITPGLALSPRALFRHASRICERTVQF